MRRERSLSEILEGLLHDVVSVRMTIDLVTWCDLDEQDELIELAVTGHSFIAKAIVEGGRPTNHYIITWEVIG